jgi:hypothetical protein
MEYRMAKLTLYHAAPSRSSITRWMLEEVGEPYDIHLLNLSNGDTRAFDYLAVNPMGKVPALKHGDVVITEAAGSAPTSPTNFRAPSSTCRSAVRAEAFISSGCSSVRTASRRR